MQNVIKRVEGKFDGEYMIGNDGVRYMVLPNYASKSRLVEGDQLRVEIMEDGAAIYKQIKPIERIRFIGHATRTPSGIGVVDEQGKIYSTLSASVRFYGIVEGDQLSCITSEGAGSCAIDQNLTPKGSQDLDLELEV